MARYPDAAWKPISKRRNSLSARIICVHTMVGSLRGTDAHFRRVGVDSHFGLGNPTDGAYLDGKVWQWVDTARVAYANADGNSDVISIETSDGGNPNNPWSARALTSLVDLIVFLCKTHDIDEIHINGNQRGKEGLAYHRQGNDHSSSYRPKGWPYDQWRPSNGVKWSYSLGKVCPGNVRIKQFVDVVIPRVKLALAPGPAKEWWEMAIPDSELDRIARRVLTLDGVIRNLSETNPEASGYYWSLAQMVSNIESDQDKYGETLKDVAADILGPWPSKYIAPDGTPSTWKGSTGEMTQADHARVHWNADDLAELADQVAALDTKLDQILAALQEHDA